MKVQLKKYLLYVLVLCTLGYGSAWAYDIHAVESDHLDPTDHLIPLFVDNASHASNQTASTTVCDHSCHAFAHMLAIATQNSWQVSSYKITPRLNNAPAFVSLIISPVQRPPRV